MSFAIDYCCWCAPGPGAKLSVNPVSVPGECADPHSNDKQDDCESGEKCGVSLIESGSLYRGFKVLGHTIEIGKIGAFTNC